MFIFFVGCVEISYRGVLWLCDVLTAS